ncbi:unnamed protein product [Microthlaspi erraticum]|uniref:MBD domain-containing protein n=1 Tax=Microthlaspi erraticum TaxID=1685480 RepID=A0A6D2I7N3_9BRAS|nr:unnamed protein product [Microthlaspi erraticum]
MSGLVVNEASAPASPSTPPVVGNLAGANEGSVLKRPRGRPRGSINKPKPVGEGSVVKDKREKAIPISQLTVQCATCFKWRVVPWMEIYEEIRTYLEEEPFFCDVACQWKPGMSCEVPADISQEGTELIWALESHLIPRPPVGWRRLTKIRNEGGSCFADIYYITPLGQTLRSGPEVIRYLKENPQYIIEGKRIEEQVKEQFSFKIPKPLQEDYVRKRPAQKMNPSGNSNAIVATGEGPSASTPNTCLALVIYQPPEEPQLHASPDEQCLAIQLYVPAAWRSQSQLLPDVPPQPEPELHASASRCPEEQLELRLDVPPEPQLHAWPSRSPEEQLQLLPDVPPEPVLQELPWRAPDERLPFIQFEPPEADLNETLWSGLSPLKQYEPDESDTATHFRSIIRDVAAKQELHGSDDRPAKRIRRLDGASTSGVNDGVNDG